MRKKTVIIIAVLFGILLALYIASEFIIPWAASKYIVSEIQERYPEAKEVSASIRSFPAFRLIFKQYSRLWVKAEGIQLEGVNFDSIELESHSWPEGTFDAVIGEDEMNRFFTLKGSFVVDSYIALEQDLIRVTGTVDVEGESGRVSATGTLEPVQGRLIFFIPQDISVEGFDLPAEAVENVTSTMKQTPIFTVRQDLPFTISNIVVEQGKLVITGDVNLEDALNISLE